MSKKESNVSDGIVKEFTKLIKQSNPNNFLMNVPEAAERLSVPEKTVYQLIESGLLQALKIKKLRVSNFEINRFIQDNYGRDLTELIK